MQRREAKRRLVGQFVEREDYSEVGPGTAWRFRVNPVEPPGRPGPGPVRHRHGAHSSLPGDRQPALAAGSA